MRLRERTVEDEAVCAQLKNRGEGREGEIQLIFDLLVFMEI